MPTNKKRPDWKLLAQVGHLSGAWELWVAERPHSAAAKLKRGRRHYRLWWSRRLQRFMRSRGTMRAEHELGASVADAAAILARHYPVELPARSANADWALLAGSAGWDIYVKAAQQPAYTAVLLRRQAVWRLNERNSYLFLWDVRHARFVETRDLSLALPADADDALEAAAETLGVSAAFLPRGQ